MQCTTIRPGVECPFMKASGCSYNGGVCHPIVDQCQGCGRIVSFPTGLYCSACPEPALKWKRGNCNMATHVVTAATENKQKINPLKASKRGGK